MGVKSTLEGAFGFCVLLLFTSPQRVGCSLVVIKKDVFKGKK